MREYEIVTDINAGEYENFIYIKCNYLIKIDDHNLKVDDIFINFPDKILRIEKVTR